jgi:hypothetical protein
MINSVCKHLDEIHNKGITREPYWYGKVVRHLSTQIDLSVKHLDGLRVKETKKASLEEPTGILNEYNRCKEVIDWLKKGRPVDNIPTRCHMEDNVSYPCSPLDWWELEKYPQQEKGWC